MNTTMSTTLGDVGVEIRANASDESLGAEIRGVGREEKATFTLVDSTVVIGGGEAANTADTGSWSTVRVFGKVGREDASEEQKTEIEEALIISLNVSFPRGQTVNEEIAKEDAIRGAKNVIRVEISRAQKRLRFLRRELDRVDP